METQITVRIVKDDKGYFIGRAVGFRGVIATGQDESQVIDRIAKAWVAIYRAKQSKSPMKTTSEIRGNAYERQISVLQAAA